MILKVRKDDKGDWGFVEKYKKYRYTDKGYVEALGVVSVEGVFVKPYVFRAGEFIPADAIDSEVGIDKYIKAKKPFYSLVKDGFIVSVRAAISFTENKVLLEESSYDVYIMNAPVGKCDEVSFKKVLDRSEKLDGLMIGPILTLGESFGDREAFLRSRLNG